MAFRATLTAFVARADRPGEMDPERHFAYVVQIDCADWGFFEE